MSDKKYTASFIDFPTDDPHVDEDDAMISWSEENESKLLLLIFGYVSGRIKIGAIDGDAFLEFITTQHPHSFSKSNDCIEHLIDTSSQKIEKVLICESYFEFSNNQDNWQASISWPLSPLSKAA